MGKYIECHACRQEVTTCEVNQYKLLYTILNNIQVYEEPVPSAKKIPHCAVKFEASEKNRIVYENLSSCGTSEGIHPGFEAQHRPHQKVKIVVSVA